MFKSVLLDVPRNTWRYEFGALLECIAFLEKLRTVKEVNSIPLGAFTIDPLAKVVEFSVASSEYLDRYTRAMISAGIPVAVESSEI